MAVFEFLKNGADVSWNWEKKKKYIENTMMDLTMDNGSGRFDSKKTFGKITENGFKAIQNKTLDSYRPANDEEKKTIAEYRKYMADSSVKNLNASIVNSGGSTFVVTNKVKSNNDNPLLTGENVSTKYSARNTGNWYDDLFRDNNTIDSENQSEYGKKLLTSTPYYGPNNETVKKNAIKKANEIIENKMKAGQSIETINGSALLMSAKSNPAKFLYENDESYRKVMQEAQRKTANDKINAEKADFEEKAQYDPAYAEIPGEYNYAFVNEKYVDWNSSDGLKNRHSYLPGKTESLKYNDDMKLRMQLYAYYMQDEERKKYNYIYKTEGKNSADYYLKSLESELLQRRATAISEAEKKFAKERPGDAAFISVMQTPFNYAPIISSGVNALFGDETDPNSVEFDIPRSKSAITEGLIEGKKGWQQDLIQAGLSIGDNLITLPFGGAIGSSVMQGINAGSSGTFDAALRTSDSRKSFGVGIAAGIIEYFTERMGLDNVFKLAKLPKSGFVKYAFEICKQMGIEGAEEAVSEILNNIADDTIMGEDSKYNIRVREYVANGYSKSDAEKMALKEVYFDNVIQSGKLGAISGGIMGAGGVGAGIVSSKVNNTKTTPSTETTLKAPIAEKPQLIAPASTEVSAGNSKVDVNASIERIVNGTATNKDIDLFKPAQVQNRQVFENATGVKLPGTNSETRKFLRGYKENQGVNTTKVEAETTTSQSVANDLDVQNTKPTMELQDAQMYNIATSNLIRKARENNLDLQTFYAETENVNAYNLTEQDIQTINNAFVKMFGNNVDENTQGNLNILSKIANKYPVNVNSSQQTETKAEGQNNVLNNTLNNGIMDTNGGVSNVRTDSNSSRQEWGTIEGTGEQGTSVSGWRELGNRRINELVGIHNENRPKITEVHGRKGEKVSYYPAAKNSQKSDAEIFVENEAKKYGVEVEYATDLTVTSKDGKVSKTVAFIKGNKVVLSDKATFKDAVHEFVHYLKNTNPQKYNTIKSYITENMQSGVYDITLNYYVQKYSEIYDFDFDSMNESQRKRAMDVIEEEFVCDMIAYNKTGSNTSMINEAEFTTLVEEYFDTNKSEISYTSQNNQKPVTTPNLTPIRFINGLDFIPLPRTKNGNVKRNISHEASLKLNDIVSNYNKNGKVDKSKVNELFDMLYNSAVVENVENFDEALDFIKNERLYISPTDKQSITDFNKFRQSMMMKLKITTDKSKGGLDIDVAYQQFNEMFPGMVNESITHPADQLQALADFVTNAKDRQKATLDEYFGSNAQNVKEQMQEMFNDELDAFLDGEEIKYAVASSEKEGAFVMSEDEIKNIQAIGRKSINDFSTEEINKTQTLAKKLYNEMGVKSPFFRAWFGDWRANDKTTLEVVEIYETKQKNPRGQFVNRDTGFSINSSSVGYDETNSHSGKDKLSVIAMQNIDKIIENAILLDTEVSEYGRGKKSVYTCFMHKFYTPVYIEGKPCIAKMSVDESYQPGAKDTNKKFYHVRAIKIEPVSSVGIGFNHTPIMDKSGSTIIVADLFNIVKKYDSEFNPKECSLVLNEDGTPMIVYHGTDAKFYVFDMSKGRANMDIQGSFFSPWELDSQGYGKNVGAYYLNIKNPADGPTAYAALNKFKGQNNAGVKAKDYLIKQGYDGVNFYDEEYVAFYPMQIKSATDNIGTFDGSNPDIRYSNDTTEKTPEYYNQRYAELLKQYGTIEKGMQPRVNDVDVPVQSGKGQYVSKFARTMAETKVFADAMNGEFEKMVVDGTLSHERITDKKAYNEAEQKIKKDGFEDAVKEFEFSVKTGKLNKNDIAMGQMLLNLACQNKDVNMAKKLAVDLSVAATQFGQNVQAFSMLKRMSPDGQLYYLEKSLQKINREIHDNYKGEFKGIEIDSKLAENLLNAKSEKEINDAVHAIEKNIGEQIPSTFEDKWNAWRYLAMLGNTRTHFRNIFGNAAFVPAKATKDIIASGIEKVILPKEERTKSITKTAESKEFAKQDWELMADVVEGNDGKYNIKRGIEEHRKIFETQWLEAVRKFNNKALNIEDGWFLRPAYESAFAQAMTARGLTAEYLSSGTKEATRQLQNIREYAINEAQRATFRDTNAFSEMVSNMRFREGKFISKKAADIGNVFVDGVLPFKKTPANILVRGIEYSPVGLMKGLTYDLYQVKKGEMSASTAIDRISAGLTGTAIVGLGAFLAHLGVLVVAPDEDDEVAGYKKMLGAQSYALNFGGNTYTIDWMSPSALPLFVGAEIMNTIKNTEQPSLTAVFDALGRISEPVFELSCLSGIQSALESIKYADGSTIDDLAIDMLSSYITQALPTIGGQVARTIDNTQRNIYYKDKTSGVPQILQSIINKAISKVPGLTYFLPEKVDRWGRTQKYGSLPERVLENFVSPGYYSGDKSTWTDKKLMDIYKKTGDNSVLPDVAAKGFKLSGETNYMSAEEYVEYSKVRGQLSYKYTTDFLKNIGTYKVDDDMKVQVINDIYRYANAKAKEEVSDYTLSKEFEKVEEAKKAGISPDKYYLVYNCKSGIEGDKDANGKTIPNSATRKQFAEIKKNVTGVSEKQMLQLLEIMGYSEKQIKIYKYNLPN